MGDKQSTGNVPANLGATMVLGNPVISSIDHLRVAGAVVAPPGTKHGEESPAFWTRTAHTVRDALSLAPGAVLTRYWSGAWRNMGVPFKQDADVAAHHVELNAQQLKRTETDIYNSFKNISVVYAYHGSTKDFTTETEKYKLTPDERDYIGLKTDAQGNVTEFLGGSEVLGYLHDKTSGARSVALRDKEGKITIAIAGGAFPNTMGWEAFKGSAGAVFASTGGNMTAQFKPIYDFAKGIEQKYGAISQIDGHSLGAAVAQCLVPAFPTAKYHLFDAPGLTPAVEMHMARFYGKSEANIKALYSWKDAHGDHNITRVRVQDNSYNTLGWIPADVTLTDPAHDHYAGANPKNLLPKNHFYGAGYYDAVRKLGKTLNDGGTHVYNNDISNDRSGGPTYITGVEAVAAYYTSTTGIGALINVAGAAEGLWAHHKDNPKPLPKSSPSR